MIEQSLHDHPAADSLLALQARVEQLEARLARPAPVRSPSPPRVAAPVNPQPVEPPFQVIGAELRGGERFLSILPSGGVAVAQLRLLGVGETEAGWSLEAIEGETAVFRHGVDTRRLIVPGQR